MDKLCNNLELHPNRPLSDYAIDQPWEQSLILEGLTVHPDAVLKHNRTSEGAPCVVHKVTTKGGLIHGH